MINEQINEHEFRLNGENEISTDHGETKLNDRHWSQRDEVER